MISRGAGVFRRHGRRVIMVKSLGKLSRGSAAWILFAGLACGGFVARGGLAAGQDSKVLGEVQFDGATKVEKDSGVWIDGGYVGYLKELKGNKKVLLLPGEHEISVRQSGYEDFVQKIVVEPGQTLLVRVTMHLMPHAQTPAITATLKVTIQPGR